jgi:hypothetical protein
MGDDLQKLVQRATAVTGKVQSGLDTLAGEVTALLGSLTRLPAGVPVPRSSAASQFFSARTDFTRTVPQHVSTWAPTCQALTNLGDAAKVFRDYATNAAEPITSEFEVHRMSAGRSGWEGPASDVYRALVGDDHLIAFTLEDHFRSAAGVLEAADGQMRSWLTGALLYILTAGVAALDAIWSAIQFVRSLSTAVAALLEGTGVTGLADIGAFFTLMGEIEVAWEALITLAITLAVLVLAVAAINAYISQVADSAAQLILSAAQAVTDSRPWTAPSGLPSLSDWTK